MTDISDPTRIESKVKRPVLVWVISIFYLISAGFTILSLVLIYSGLIPVNEVQKAYFDGLTPIDHISTVLIGSLNLLGAVFLFILRKHAFHFFLAGFVAGLMTTTYHIIAKNWIETIGTAGFIGAAIGWGISISIILYSKRLRNRGILN
ncbi:hypothetical protein OAH36_05310 [Verrucomicrobia bacterium]|nr:hypothetical protein [Verrucomicrobiota bacterium]MDB4798993.1 hypothetical protein [Verrucomicrobiota bacterium]